MSHHSNSRLMKLDRALDKCPRCAHTPMVIDAAGGELFCSACGFVVKEKLEEVGPEWRSFSNEEKDERSRVGLPTSVAISDMGLATVIGGENRDASGRSLSGSMKSTVERLRTWDRRSQAHESSDRNLRQAFSELRRYADKLTVGEAVVEKAAYIYRKAFERGLVRGRSITAIMVASLYAACRDMEVPRTLKDLAAISNVKRKDIARSYRLLYKEMDMHMPVVDPAKCVSKIASRAQMKEKTRPEGPRDTYDGRADGDIGREGPYGIRRIRTLRRVHAGERRQDAEGHRRGRRRHRSHDKEQVQGPQIRARLLGRRRAGDLFEGRAPWSSVSSSSAITRRRSPGRERAPALAWSPRGPVAMTRSPDVACCSYILINGCSIEPSKIGEEDTDSGR